MGDLGGIFGAGYLWPILKTLGRKNWGTWGVTVCLDFRFVCVSE